MESLLPSLSGLQRRRWIYLPGSAPQEVVELYAQAFRDIIASLTSWTRWRRTGCLFNYTQLTGAAGKSASDHGETKSLPRSKSLRS